MSSSGRPRALTFPCALAAVLGACAINPQPEPPMEAVPGTVGGAGGAEAGSAWEDGGAGTGASANTGGSGGAGGSGGVDPGGSGGAAGTGGTSNVAPPAAYDEGYVDDDSLGARFDAVNETDAGADDAAEGDAASDDANGP